MLNALAYVVGQDMVFGIDQYAPSTISGQRLLAHELTHLVQRDTIAMNIIQKKIATPQQTPSKTGGNICLTFDDGPGPGTKDVLDALGDSPATFFLIGENAKKHVDLVIEIMMKKQHQIGTHTFKHYPLSAGQYAIEYGSLIAQKNAARKQRESLEKKLEITSQSSADYKTISEQKEQAKKKEIELQEQLKEKLKKNIEEGEKPVKEIMESQKKLEEMMKKSKDGVEKIVQDELPQSQKGELLFRLPGGGPMGKKVLQSEIIAAIKSMGRTPIPWNFEFCYPVKKFPHLKCEWDVKNVGVECRKGPKSGDIVLFHDSHWAGRKQILKGVLEVLKGQKYGFSFGKLNAEGKCQ